MWEIRAICVQNNGQSSFHTNHTFVEWNKYRMIMKLVREGCWPQLSDKKAAPCYFTWEQHSPLAQTPSPRLLPPEVLPPEGGVGVGGGLDPSQWPELVPHQPYFQKRERDSTIVICVRDHRWTRLSIIVRQHSNDSMRLYFTWEQYSPLAHSPSPQLPPPQMPPPEGGVGVGGQLYGGVIVGGVGKGWPLPICTSAQFQN